MYRDARTPAWHRDLVWIAGGIAVVATLVAAFGLWWSRAADADRGPEILVTALRATLLPDEAEALPVGDGAAIVPGEAFEALPGAGLRIDPDELDRVDAAAVLDRAAQAWTATLLEEGRTALLDGVPGTSLALQLRRAVDGPVTDLVEAQLAEELLPAGLGDGSRMANWPLQAQRAPGEPVQPIVGIFVTVDPAELQGLSPGQIGERIVRRLAESTVASGADAAREVLANDNLAARYEQGLAQARSATRALFDVVLVARTDEVAARLAEAREVARAAAAGTPRLDGALAGVDVSGLPTDAANERILEALAQAVWEDGVDAAREALGGDPRSERLSAAAPVLTRFGADAQRRATRWAVSAAVVALVALALVAALASGAGRLGRPGAALLLAAAPGSALAWALLRGVERWQGAGLPAGAGDQGAFATLAGLVAHLLGGVPAELAREGLIVHGSLAAAGAVLILAAAVVAVAGALRPRRRGYL
jgi:hypothetical protein